MKRSTTINKYFWIILFTVPITFVFLRSIWLTHKQEWQPIYPEYIVNDTENESNSNYSIYLSSDASNNTQREKNLEVLSGKNKSENTVSSSIKTTKQQEVERQDVPNISNNNTNLRNETTSSTNEKQLEHKKIRGSEEDIEECGCPNSKENQRLLKRYDGGKCTLSDCTNYTLDVSKLEKPDTPFVKYDGVVMATKILRPKDLPMLKQMVCLFNAAYNRHVGYYDIIVFTTLPWTSQEIKEFEEFAAPANVTIVRDSPPLEDVLTSMTIEEVSFLKKRCGCAENETLSWHHYCTEEGGTTTNLGYSWQAEFRTYHIWKQPALAKYKYMIWMDSDALPTKNWDKDPMKVMIDNDLVVMFEHWPQGHANHDVVPKIIKAYNQSLCVIKMADGGYFDTVASKNCDEQKWLLLIHGFHHITNLDFYRSERTMHFLKMMVEDYKFSRKFDDQMAVTLPAAMDAPKRAWDHTRNGLNLSLYHNNMIGEKHLRNHGGYRGMHWRENRKKWFAGAAMCNQYIVLRG